jgi:methylglutaconyl-CoA hydratase
MLLARAPLHSPSVGDRLVGVRERDGVRTITLDSPSNRNALSSRLLDELAGALEEATTESAVRAVVLTGAGTVFCSGADLSERGSAAPNRMPEILRMLVESPTPVIARVNGAARAGGLGLIAAADMAVAAESATFGFSEVRVGVAPAMILVPALRVVEPRFLARAVLTAEPFTAAEAAAAGLLSAVVPDEPALDAWVASRTRAIGKAAPGAVRATKELLRALSSEGFDDGLEHASRRSAELFASEEAAEGMAAFLEKRRPAWDTDS